MFKKQNGITLVALVVTIIVLIILAAVTITMVAGQDGILNRAQQGTKDYKNAEANELLQLDELNTNIDARLNELL